ncbi:WYL domain-containing protein [Vibrio parahaemolyticus]|uniref:WYL domain-containing protein n=1 Tax=Vibrio parahaemolyticus TaxID=670 RepID=UPI0015DAA198|nr:WYL domain-containing protein [Vibrio parahaemolyticus]MBE3838237.1 WYL domain-containing protein [Vibrio parahaemolyticus]MDF4599997.1 WYL domain-containing protein [Vibrio parahaemolyticus]MDF4631273.1 WYL domain-containing protein [Vibrio parahaemolyticus]MDF4646408.1 WYL domain-containing protein [Vibrio parahaemolyticus]HBN6280112.1 WYL domain-containing protein [Vibrio parahaemolyticus]
MYTINKLAEHKHVKSHAKAERLAFIDFKVRFEGSINRSDISKEFGVSETISSKDISLYRKLTGGTNLVPNRTNIIQLDTYKPLIDIKAHNALDMLFEGFCRNRLEEQQSENYMRACHPCDLNPDQVSTVTRAIYQKTRISIRYVSANSNKRTERILEPIGAYYDGLNWVFRALDISSDSEKQIYKSFHFSRIIGVAPLDKKSTASIIKDTKWNAIVPMQLELHPELSELEKEAYRKDFGMGESENELIVANSLVISWSLIERWHIDTNIKPLPINRFIFHLKNAQTLRSIDGFNFLITDYDLVKRAAHTD